MSLQCEMTKIQNKIKQLTNMKPPTPLPPVPMVANLARGSSEMWQIYQYQLREYETLMNLPSEIEFLKRLVNFGELEGIKIVLRERLHLLAQKKTATAPILCQPTTSSQPLNYAEKVDRAKLIAQHLVREETEYDPMKNLEEIKQLQNQLMDLEEQYLNERN